MPSIHSANTAAFLHASPLACSAKHSLCKWRGTYTSCSCHSQVWNLLDTLLGTDNSLANLGSMLIGLSIMLLFRILRLPLAEFW